MISFREFIIEALDSSYPVEYTVNGSKDALFTFETKNGERMSVIFELQQSYKSDEVFVEVAFNVSGNGKAFTTKPTGTQSTSDALKVYSTIGKELEKFVKKTKPDFISFSAVFAKTIPVYRHLAKRIANQLNGEVKEDSRRGSFHIYLNR